MVGQPLRKWDLAYVAVYCMLLYGIVLGVGGPLTMHEGVLSQTARAMQADRDWVVPHYGQAPWLERPPMPQWFTVALGTLLGGCDREWVIRLGPALAGLITVLLTTWLAAQFFGRGVGILSGLILATMYEFIRYSTLAEADMFLCPIVAGTLCCFAYLELLQSSPSTESMSFLGLRSRAVVGFFVLLGMTELAKGLVFGTAMAVIPMGGYLLLTFRPPLWRRYVWLWGWLISLVIGLAWPIAVYQRYPDALELWHFDLVGRLNQGYLREPAWYYFATWFWVVVPWPLAGILGLIVSARTVFTERTSPQRFLWCWAILTPLVFSLSQGKHHHYMIHFLAPWAMLAGLGTQWLWRKSIDWPTWLRLPILPALLGVAADGAIWLLRGKIAGPAWMVPSILVALPCCLIALWSAGWQRDSRRALVATFACWFVLYCVGFTYKSTYQHRSNDDTAFLMQVRATVPPGAPLLVTGDQEALEGLRVLFYCDANTMLLHNLSFLRDRRIPSDCVYLAARARDLPRIETYGQAELLLQSKQSRREEGPHDRWSLYRVYLRPDLERKSGDVRISPMQAMYRVDGPSLD